MTIRKTAYDTLACRGYAQAIQKVAHSLKEAMINHWVSTIEKTDIYKLEQSNEAVPAFAHPLITQDQRNEECLFVDLRSYGSWDSRQSEYKIRDKINYAFAVKRAQLNRIWITEETDLVRNISKLPMAIYAAWISEQVGRRYFLEANEQFTVAVLAAVFYYSQFHDRTEESAPFSKEEKSRLSNYISLALRCNPNDVMKIVDHYSIIPDLHAFCAVLASHSDNAEVQGSVRLKDLNHGVLMTLVGTSWFGANARELLSVALEHPPTWMTIVFMAFYESSYKESAIAKITERKSYRQLGEEYTRAFSRLLDITIETNHHMTNLVTKNYTNIANNDRFGYAGVVESEPDSSKSTFRT